MIGDEQKAWNRLAVAGVAPDQVLIEKWTGAGVRVRASHEGTSAEVSTDEPGLEGTGEVTLRPLALHRLADLLRPTRHWVDFIVQDGCVDYELVCEHPDYCTRTDESIRHLGCEVKKYWREESIGLFEVSADVTISRVEVDVDWRGHSEEQELYLLPKIPADGGKDAMFAAARAQFVHGPGDPLGVKNLPSPAEAVDRAVAAIWEAGYRLSAAPPAGRPGICRRTDLAALSLGKNCPDCGHWPMAHTIGGNHQMPDDECQICLLTSLAAQASQASGPSPEASAVAERMRTFMGESIPASAFIGGGEIINLWEQSHRLRDGDQSDPEIQELWSTLGPQLIRDLHDPDPATFSYWATVVGHPVDEFEPEANCAGAWGGSYLRERKLIWRPARTHGPGVVEPVSALLCSGCGIELRIYANNLVHPSGVVTSAASS